MGCRRPKAGRAGGDALGPTTVLIGASVDLTGLRMASDTDFNRKSFTTGHTGFGVPFAVNPDRLVGAGVQPEEVGLARFMAS